MGSFGVFKILLLRSMVSTIYSLHFVVVRFWRLKALADVVDDLVGLGLAAKVGRQKLALLQTGIDGGVDGGSGLLLALELEHERSRSNGSNGVSDALTLDVRCRAVAGLTNNEVLSDIGRWDETKRTNESGSAVRQDVSVQVGCDDDIVVLGLTEELVDHRVDNLLLDIDELVLLLGERLAGSLAEETVGLRQHVGLVGNSD